MQRSDPLRYVRIRYGVLRWADLHRIEPPPKETFLIYDLIELHYDKECLGADIIVIASDGSEMTCGTRFMLLVNTNYYNSSRRIMKAFFNPFFQMTELHSMKYRIAVSISSELHIWWIVVREDDHFLRALTSLIMGLSLRHICLAKAMENFSVVFIWTIWNPFSVSELRTTYNSTYIDRYLVENSVEILSESLVYRCTY